MTGPQDVHASAPTAPKSRAPAAGWICYIIGMALMFISVGGFFIVYAPLFLASFVLSIISMAQRRIAAGVFLLVVTLIIPPVTGLVLASLKVASIYHANQETKQKALNAVVVEEAHGSVDGNYMYCKGKVRNTGATSVDFVKVGVEWLDKDGIVIDSGYTYAVGGEGLGPGVAKSFEIMTPADGRMKRFRCQLNQ